MKPLRLTAVAMGAGHVALHGGVWLRRMVVSLQGYLARKLQLQHVSHKGKLTLPRLNLVPVFHILLASLLLVGCSVGMAKSASQILMS